MVRPWRERDQLSRGCIWSGACPNERRTFASTSKEGAKEIEAGERTLYNVNGFSGVCMAMNYYSVHVTGGQYEDNDSREIRSTYTVREADYTGRVNYFHVASPQKLADITKNMTGGLSVGSSVVVKKITKKCWEGK
jgi:hypothetical protein